MRAESKDPSMGPGQGDGQTLLADGVGRASPFVHILFFTSDGFQISMVIHIEEDSAKRQCPEIIKNQRIA